MIKYTRVTSAIASGLVLAACAANTQSVKPTAQAASTGAPDAGCMTEKGTRIAAAGASCSVVGRSYSGVDVGRTGVTNAGKALQLLDPSIVSINH
jgi:hypothetical protein